MTETFFHGICKSENPCCMNLTEIHVLVIASVIHSSSKVVDNTLDYQFRPRGYRNISCSTKLKKKFFLLINVKMPTNVGILTMISRKNSTLGLSEPEKC